MMSASESVQKMNIWLRISKASGGNVSVKNINSPKSVTLTFYTLTKLYNIDLFL